jgi:membrane protease YdiL (CAAX protease family)
LVHTNSNPVVVKEGKKVKPVVIDRKPIMEIIVIMILLLVFTIFLKPWAGLVAPLPIVYYFVERRLRNRDKSEGDLKFASLPKDIVKNWHLILLVAVVFQVTMLLLTKYFSPDFIEHVKARVPEIQNFDAKMLLTLLIAPLGEEIIFRALFQQRLSQVMKPFQAILLTSALFALFHFSSGSPMTVFFDMVGVMADSIVFGMIYLRTRNILASWFAHSLADIVAVLLMVYWQ